mmetsp:Transcript_25905/g.33985  ORF Transcript_25905/g.33985 Transcript_25905/m.33985 type:complete len:590 (+) Transcript_25905:115-1884(+)
METPRLIRKILLFGSLLLIITWIMYQMDTRAEKNAKGQDFEQRLVEESMEFLPQNRGQEKFVPISIPDPKNHSEYFWLNCAHPNMVTYLYEKAQRGRLSRQPKMLVAFIVHSREGFQAMLPLIREMEHSTKSKYLPILVVTMGVISDEELQSAVTPEDKKFSCRIFQIQHSGVEILQAVASATKAMVFFGTKGVDGSEHLQASLKELKRKYKIPFVMIPPAEFEYVTWLAHVMPVAFQNWEVPQIVISIITANRPESLERLLVSLTQAYYIGDQVNLILNTESFSDPETLKLVANFEWPHGIKTVKHRIRPGGLIPAVMESWYPKDLDEYGILLEDDIEVSKFFYIWCRYNLMTYRYGYSHNWEGGLFGFSLYTPRKNELNKKAAGTKWDSNEYFLEKTGEAHTPYMHALPCSWGALYFPKIWMEFHLFVTKRIEVQRKVEIEGSSSNGWSDSWKKFFFEMVHLNDYYMIYPNFNNQSSFSTNHMGAGIHIKNDGGDQNHRPEDFTVPLLEDFSMMLSQLPEGKLPNLRDLPALTLLGEFQKASYYFKKVHQNSSIYQTTKLYEAYLKCIEKKKGTACVKDIRKFYINK